MTTYTSQIAGKLTPVEFMEDFLTSEEIQLPLLKNQAVNVELHKADLETDPQYLSKVDQALTKLLAYPLSQKETITMDVFGNYDEAAAAMNYGEDEDDEAERALWSIDWEEADKVWQYVYPTTIWVKQKTDGVFLLVQCECEWDEEHGIQIVFKNGDEYIEVGLQHGNY
ncbi:MAG: hypothetical protein AAFP89_21155 [Bacteroidota bacterium]